MSAGFAFRFGIAAVAAALAMSAVSCGMLRDDTDKAAADSSVGTTAAVVDGTDAPATGGTEAIIQPTEIIVEDGQFSFETLCSAIESNPSLTLVNTGSALLTLEQYVSLATLAKDADVISLVDVEGVTVDLSAGEADISGKVIADKEAFSTFLSLIPDGTKLVMCDCGYTNEEMGALRESYPSLDLVWRLYLGKWSLRTDDEAFSVLIYASDTYTRMTSEDIEVLKYCTNLYAVDLGHQAITDISVLGEIPTLRVIILADNLITDITPLGKLKDLQYLELFVNRITDLSPLANCTNLVDLNFGWNRVYDLSPIYSLEKIERLWLPTTQVPVGARDEITANFPNAQIVFEDVNSVSSGWRTHERYFSMRGMFDNNKYDENFVK